MPELVIAIKGYVESIAVYIDNVELKLHSLSLFSTGTFVNEVETGTHRVKICKSSAIVNSKWKRKIFLDWLSCLFGTPDFTLKEACLETQLCTIEFEINTLDSIKIILNISHKGFEIISGKEDCSNIIKNSMINSIAQKRVKWFYIFPIAILICIILGFFYIGGFILAIKKHLFKSLIFFIIALLLTVLFAYMIKKSLK